LISFIFIDWDIKLSDSWFSMNTILPHQKTRNNDRPET
jgi:hypothetical protein